MGRSFDPTIALDLAWDRDADKRFPGLSIREVVVAAKASGETRLINTANINAYALVLNCDVARMLNRRPFEVRDKLIVKVGYSNDPTRRCADLNKALPPAMQVRWKSEFASRAFPSGQAAKDAEDGLKVHLARISESLGDEFYLCSKSDLQTAFIAATRSTAAFSLSA